MQAELMKDSKYISEGYAPRAILSATAANGNVLCCNAAAAGNAASRRILLCHSCHLLLLIGVDSIDRLIAGITRRLIAVGHRRLDICIAGTVVALHGCRRLVGTVRLVGGTGLISILIGSSTIVTTGCLSIRIILGQLIQCIAALLLRSRACRITCCT